MPLELTLYTPAGVSSPPVPIQPLTSIAQNLQFGTAIPGGFSSCSFSVILSQNEAYEWYATRGGYHVEVTDGGGTVWEGRIESISLEPFGVSVGCVGYWASLTDKVRTQWWSDSQIDSWKEASIFLITASGLPTPAFSNSKFAVVKGGGIAVSLRYPETYYKNDAAGFVYMLPLPPFGVAKSEFWMQPGTIKVLEIAVRFTAGNWPSGRTAEMELNIYDTPDYMGGMWTLRQTITRTGLYNITLATDTRGVLLRAGPRLS